MHIILEYTKLMLIGFGMKYGTLNKHLYTWRLHVTHYIMYLKSQNSRKEENK